MNRSEQILLGIKDAKTLYERQLDPLLERNGLSKLQIDVLLFLYNNPEHDTAQSV